MAAGQKLKLLRNKRNITVREVEQASQRIAELIGDKKFRISNGWLAQLENGTSAPNIWKLFTLSVIYDANISDLLRFYDIDVDEREKFESVVNLHLTHLVSKHRISDTEVTASAVTSLMPELKRATPALGCEGDSNLVYGYVGSTDLTMYPLIRPNSLLQIDTSQDKLQPGSWHNEFERPIFFVELRNGFACGWCEMQGNQLLIIPHPLSTASIRRFTYPREAEIVGRVVAYHTRCVDSELAPDSKQRSATA